MKRKYVPIGGKVNINGKVYECQKVNYFDCGDCDLFLFPDCSMVSCVGEFREDGNQVIYKEVKDGK